MNSPLNSPVFVVGYSGIVLVAVYALGVLLGARITKYTELKPVAIVLRAPLALLLMAAEYLALALIIAPFLPPHNPEAETGIFKISSPPDWGAAGIYLLAACIVTTALGIPALLMTLRTCRPGQAAVCAALAAIGLNLYLMWIGYVFNYDAGLYWGWYSSS